jgi:hypothetical protein
MRVPKEGGDTANALLAKAAGLERLAMSMPPTHARHDRFGPVPQATAEKYPAEHALSPTQIGCVAAMITMLLAMLAYALLATVTRMCQRRTRDEPTTAAERNVDTSPADIGYCMVPAVTSTKKPQLLEDNTAHTASGLFFAGQQPRRCDDIL